MRCWQAAPLHGGGQRQRCWPGPSTQVPPFWQGLLEHVLSSVQRGSCPLQLPSVWHIRVLEPCSSKPGSQAKCTSCSTRYLVPNIRPPAGACGAGQDTGAGSGAALARAACSVLRRLFIMRRPSAKRVSCPFSSCCICRTAARSCCLPGQPWAAGVAGRAAGHSSSSGSSRGRLQQSPEAMVPRSSRALGGRKAVSSLRPAPLPPGWDELSLPRRPAHRGRGSRALAHGAAGAGRCSLPVKRDEGRG